MKEWICTFIKSDGKDQVFYFIDAPWLNEEYCKSEVEKIYGPVTDFKMELKK